MAASPTENPVSQQPSAEAGSGAKPGASSRVIVVFGTKGGVGKTVVATNLAVSLAQRLRKSVALLDFDVMGVGDPAKMLGLSSTRSIVDLMPTLKRTASKTVALEDVVTSHGSGVHLYPCVSNIRQVAQLDPKLLPHIFQSLRQRYEYIIVDGGKSFSDALLTAFDAANLILLVATPDIISLYQTKWALALVESLLFPSMMVKVVLNRAESRGGVGRQDVRSAIPCEVVGEIPSDGRTVGTSLNQGEPLVTAFSYTKVAESFVRLADALVARDDLYVAHQDVPRHRRGGENGSMLPATSGMWSTRLYLGEDEAPSGEELVDEIVIMKQRIHERLVEELDLKRLDLSSLSNSDHLAELRQRSERVITNLLAQEMGGLVSAPEVRERLVKEIADEALGLGPLEGLLEDAEITDILVNNKDQIYVERRGKLELTTKKFITNDQVRAVIERIVAPLGRRIDEANPMVDARLPDGSRVNAIIPPLSLKGPVLSIRKFSRRRFSQDDLLGFRTLSPAMSQFIRACVLARKNIIISGGTGSGKTTLLNIVSAFIPEGERIITIEDAAELKLAQTHWVSLEGRPPNVEGKGQVAIRDLFRNALRMRPDRIVIGECRGAETLDMLQAMNTGHDGSITTVHANSPRDVMTRLDSMILMSNIELPVRAIREMVASAIDMIIHTARLSDGSRKITAITELVGLANDTDVAFQDLFLFQQTGVGPDGAVLGDFVATGTPPTFLEELRIKGIEMDEAAFAAPHNPTGAG